MALYVLSLLFYHGVMFRQRHICFRENRIETNFQGTISGAHQASYPMDKWGSSLKGKSARARSWPVAPCSAVVKECAELYFYSPNTHSLFGSQLKLGDNFNCTLNLYSMYCLETRQKYFLSEESTLYELKYNQGTHFCTFIYCACSLFRVCQDKLFNKHVY
jgi:hypothetical protein